MRAKVKEGSPVLAVTAFGGLQYTRHEWRDVPPEAEIEALQHPYLEIEPEAVEPEKVGVISDKLAKPKGKTTRKPIEDDTPAETEPDTEPKSEQT